MTREELRDYVDFLRSQYEISYDVYSALIDGIDALEQEPSRDIKEIVEIMKCGVDAETKCKMISNILTAEPHYFGKQNPCDKCAMKNSNSNYCKNCTVSEYHGKIVSVPTKFIEQESCDDAISRDMALKECHDIVVEGERYRVIQEETLLGLPPVTPTCEEREKGECPYYAG